MTRNGGGDEAEGDKAEGDEAGNGGCDEAEGDEAEGDAQGALVPNPLNQDLELPGSSWPGCTRPEPGLGPARSAPLTGSS